jgi:DNA-directed RNA polymerase omega subunit
MLKAHEISTEDLCKMIPNKFQMVLVASLRAKELRKNKTPMPISTALNDIISGKIDVKALDKLRDKK